jgi:hypothetical protein
MLARRRKDEVRHDARPGDEIKPEIDLSLMSWIAESWNDMTAHVDLSLFRDDIDAAKAVDIICWTIEGYSRKWVEAGHRLSYYQERYDKMIDELDLYLEILRRLFFK